MKFPFRLAVPFIMFVQTFLPTDFPIKPES